MEFEWSNKTRERDHLPYERLDNGKDEYGHYLANDLKRFRYVVCVIWLLVAG
jgi:hypothetical protein